MTAPHRLLISALVFPEPQAEDAWCSWRTAVNLDLVEPASFHLLPGLAGRIPAWTSDDPSRALLLGICRRAWSQNQLVLKFLTEALETLRAGGIERVAATGPVAWGALYWPERAVRPASIVDLVVEPAQARLAIELLQRAGLTPRSRMPDASPRSFPFEPAVLLRAASGSQLRLHWRAVPNTDFSLQSPPALSFDAMPPGQIAPYTIPPEHALVAALGGLLDDAVDWRCDALLICRRVTDWDAVGGLLRRRSAARDRLAELRRDWDPSLPAGTIGPPWTSGIERALAGSLQIYRRAKRRLTSPSG
jgi:hypothetical protein